MITRREDYKYAGGDIDKVIIDGGIMPLRSEGDKRILRGEDVCFLLEAAITNGNVFTTAEKIQDGEDRTNPLVIEHADFSRELRRYGDEEVEENDSMAYASWLVYKNMFMYAPSLLPSRSVFLKEFPHVIELQDFGSQQGSSIFFKYEPVIKDEDCEGWDSERWKDKALRANRVMSVFNDVQKCKYVALYVKSMCRELNEVIEVGNPPMVPSYLKGNQYVAGSKSYEGFPTDRWQGYATFGLSDRIVIHTTGWFRPTRIFAYALFRFFYNGQSGVSSGAYEGIIDITDIVGFSVSDTSVVIESINPTKEWILSHPDRLGMPIYTASSSPDCGCDYHIRIEELFLVSEIDNRIKWW